MRRYRSRLIGLLAMLAAAALIAGGATVYAYQPVFDHSDSYASSEFYLKLTQLEPSGDAREDFVNIALTQVGYFEGAIEGDYDGSTSAHYNNFTEYGFNFGDPDCVWCTTFVWWCARQAGLDKSVFPDTVWPRLMTVNCPYVGYTTGASVSRGDILFVENTGDSTPDHLAIVTEVTDFGICTVEGNCGNTVCEVVYQRDIGARSDGNGAILYIGYLNFSHDPAIPDASSLMQTVTVTAETAVYDRLINGSAQGTVNAGEQYALLAVSPDAKWYQIEWRDHAYWMDADLVETSLAGDSSGLSDEQTAESTTEAATEATTEAIIIPTQTTQQTPGAVVAHSPESAANDTTRLLVVLLLIVAVVFIAGISIVMIRDRKHR